MTAPSKLTRYIVRMPDQEQPLVKLKTMREWAERGATRKTREKIAKKLRGKE